MKLLVSLIVFTCVTGFFRPCAGEAYVDDLYDYDDFAKCQGRWATSVHCLSGGRKRSDPDSSSESNDEPSLTLRALNPDAERARRMLPVPVIGSEPLVGKIMPGVYSK